MEIKVFRLPDGQDWIARVVSKIGGSLEVEAPFRIFFRPDPSGDKATLTISPAIQFSADPFSVRVIVEPMYIVPDPEQGLVDYYKNTVDPSGLITPKKSGLILG